MLVYNRPPRTTSPASPALAGPDAAYAGSLPSPALRRPSAATNWRTSLCPPRSKACGRPACRTFTFLVTQGTAIPCVLETVNASDVAGLRVLRDRARRDVRFRLQVVLMEKGTQVVGEYRGQVRRGAKRMFVLWSRAKTPTGVARGPCLARHGRARPGWVRR